MRKREGWPTPTGSLKSNTAGRELSVDKIMLTLVLGLTLFVISQDYINNSVEVSIVKTKGIPMHIISPGCRSSWRGSTWWACRCSPSAVRC